jgi:ribosomal protein S18 acetylase RimI-like enzyme
MALHLRPARASDYAPLAGWIPDAEACGRWAGPRLTFPFAPEALEGLLAVATGASFALEDGTGALVGFGQYWVREPGAVHLGRIVVAPDHRGRGLGGDLCRRLMAEALAATGAASLTLRVYRGNAAARALYASLGFRDEPSPTDPDPILMRAVPASAGAPGPGDAR